MATARMSADGSIAVTDARARPEHGGQAGAGADVHHVRRRGTGPLHDHLNEVAGGLGRAASYSLAKPAKPGDGVSEAPFPRRPGGRPLVPSRVK